MRKKKTESSFISTRESHGQLQNILTQIFYGMCKILFFIIYTDNMFFININKGLRDHGQCDVLVNDANAIRLRLLPAPVPFPPIKIYMVPVILRPGE